MITKLKNNQIFVFGSNIKGEHIGGAAKQAYEQFGAKWGQGIGLQGQSWALPTLGFNMERLSLEEIQENIEDLVEYAKYNPNIDFLLTPIGTGIAGFTLEEIKSILPKLPKNITKVGKWE